MPRVLIVEDQDRVAKALAVLLELDGLPSVTVRSAEAALAALDAGGFDLVLQDMNFTPGETSGDEGARLFADVRARHPALPVLLLTAWAKLETAVSLVRDGAVDYVEKPWDDRKLLASVRARLAAERPATRTAALPPGFDACGTVWASAAMQELVALAARVAASDVPVLVTGESGTGKEKIAEILHANSRRRSRPFVKIDAGALPESLVESELFGAEAGAYTGASKRRLGRFEAADGGTILLDEIGNLPLAGQAKLLRVLQSGEVSRLGSARSQAVDVRVVAATNTDLARSIAAGEFREDLFYRLAVIELRVPRLAERRADILPLAERFLREEAAGSRPRTLEPDARAALVEHDWPGNVRELRNRIQRAALLAGGTAIGASELGFGTGGRRPAPGDAAGPGASGTPVPDPTAAGEDAAERAAVEAALLDAGGVVAHAADRLGLTRQALYRRMERLGIHVERRLRS